MLIILICLLSNVVIKFIKFHFINIFTYNILFKGLDIDNNKIFFKINA